MKRIIFVLLIALNLVFTVRVCGKPSSAGVSDAVKQALPKGYSIENSISKTDEVSINDVAIRYGFTGKDMEKPYYGYQCDIASKNKSMAVEVTSFYLEEDAFKALERFSDGYTKYLTGLAGLEQSRFKTDKKTQEINGIQCKILDYKLDDKQQRSAAFVKYNFLIVLSYSEDGAKDAESFLSLLNQGLTDASVEDAKITGRTYMEVSFTPSCFSEKSDTVDITVTVHYPENYKGKKPLDVIMLNDTETGKQIQSKPLGTGQGVFIVKQIDKSIVAYKYTVSCGDFTKEIIIPLLKTGIELEYNMLTDIRYTGIVADGFQTIKIKVTLTGMNKGVLEIHQPELGKVMSFRVLQNKKIKNPDEIVEFEYIPPKYIEGELEKETVSGDDLYFVTVPLKFTYTPEDGTPIDLSTDLKVYRPPIVLTIARDTPFNEIDGLYRYLKENNNNVYRYEEQSKDDALEIMNERFVSYLKDFSDRFIGRGIKITRFDVVSYGLSGIITRNYIKSSLYRNDIRKCILIAVPNHGLYVETLDSDSQWSQMGSVLKKQMTSGSDFMKKLNTGEQYAEHINELIQYANLSAYSGKPAFMEGDGVIPLWSSYMNGVTNKIYWQMAHSKSFSGSVPAILYAQEVYEDIDKYLNEDIPAGRLYQMKVFLSRTEGKVTVTNPGSDNMEQGSETVPNESDLPYQITSGQRVNTGDGKAILQTYLDSVLVSEIFLDKNSTYIPGNFCEGILYGNIEKGNIYVRNLSKKVRNVVFFEGEAGIYKSSMQNSDCLVETDKEQSISCYKGTAFFSLHEPGITGDLKSVNANNKVYIKNDKTESIDENSFHRDAFYKRTFKDKMGVWKFYVTDTVKELIKYVVETGNMAGLLKHNRRLLIPVIAVVVLLALFFGAMANRKIRLGVITIIVVAGIFFILKR